jgi:hypothetical protein
MIKDNELIAIMNGERLDGTRHYEILFLNRKRVIIKAFNIWANNKGDARAISHEWALRISRIPYSSVIVNCVKAGA